ncbi:hypothetical protein T12_1574 [Trichinella patagoniensis]|uniref:Uncharacterized protein n=1 Tax=Trichinella patagoniensis TaxID=990121 RepID=A0A0V0ZEZ2_9BILA|nr:hypothetical protein T12_1574 [Trichinella patagoniensis]
MSCCCQRVVYRRCALPHFVCGNQRKTELSHVCFFTSTTTELHNPVAGSITPALRISFATSATTVVARLIDQGAQQVRSLCARCQCPDRLNFGLTFIFIDGLASLLQVRNGTIIEI